MNVPKYRLGAVKHTSKFKLAKKFPAPFSYTIKHKGWIGRYFSDSPGFAAAEAWRARWEKQETSEDGQEKLKSWCLLDTTDSLDSVFYIWVQDGVVRRATETHPNELDNIWLIRSEVVFVTDPTLEKYLPDEVKATLCEPLTEQELAPFALKAPAAWLNNFRLLFIPLLLGISALIWWYSSTPPPAPPPKPDPEIAFRHAMATQLAAGSVIAEAVTLGAYGELLPTGWSFNGVHFRGEKLTLSAKREESGLRSVIDSWLNTHSALLPLANLSDKGLTLSHSQLRRLSNDIDRVPFSATAVALSDTLIKLGWQLGEPTEGIFAGMAKSTMMITNKSAALSDLQSLSQLLSSLPVAIEQLNMNVTPLPGQFNSSITLVLLGEKP